MPAADVFFTTTYGSTRRYAEELAARLGTVARPLDEARAADLSASQAPLVIASPTFGPQVEAADFLADAEIGTRPAAAVAVADVVEAGLPGPAAVAVAHHGDVPGLRQPLELALETALVEGVEQPARGEVHAIRV